MTAVRAMPGDTNTRLLPHTHRLTRTGSSGSPPATRRRGELLARVVLALALVIRSPAPALALDAAGWLQKSQVARFPGRNYRARFAIMIREPDGTQLRRKGTAFRQSRDDGLADRLFVIRAPDHLQDLALLSKDRPGKPAAQWLYIPAYRRARRVAVHAAGDGFVGSDFTYADLGRVRIEAGTHRLKGTTELRGRPCIVIETISTDPNLPYATLVSILDRESALPLRTEYHDAHGRLTRVGTIDKVVTIGGWPTPVTLSMRDETTGGHSTIRLDDVRYDQGLDADLFTVRHLEGLSSDD